jgi:hypothetical protein
VSEWNSFHRARTFGVSTLRRRIGQRGLPFIPRTEPDYLNLQSLHRYNLRAHSFN